MYDVIAWIMISNCIRFKKFWLSGSRLLQRVPRCPEQALTLAGVPQKDHLFHKWVCIPQLLVQSLTILVLIITVCFIVPLVTHDCPLVSLLLYVQTVATLPGRPIGDTLSNTPNVWYVVGVFSLYPVEFNSHVHCQHSQQNFHIKSFGNVKFSRWCDILQIFYLSDFTFFF